MREVTEGVERRETPSESERQAAQLYVNGYIYRIDPDCDPMGRVPPEKIQGAWAVDERGEIVGAFHRNSNYRGRYGGSS